MRVSVDCQARAMPLLPGVRGANSVMKRSREFGKRPRMMVGTLVGTLACFIMFVHHYSNDRDDSSEQTPLIPHIQR